MEGQIRKVMSSTLIAESTKVKVPLKDLRIKMVLAKDESSTECFILDKTTEIKELGWQSILGFALMTFKMMVVTKITESLKRIADENSINRHDINARIYSIDEKGTPNIYIYNGKKAFKQIEINDIV